MELQCSGLDEQHWLSCHPSSAPNSIYQWLPTKPRLPGNLWKVMTEQQNHPVPHRCVFLIKNNRHLWTPRIYGATWSHRCYSKILDFLVIIYFANSLRLWNSRDNLPPKRKPKQKSSYNPPLPKKTLKIKINQIPLKQIFAMDAR